MLDKCMKYKREKRFLSIFEYDCVVNACIIPSSFLQLILIKVLHHLLILFITPCILLFAMCTIYHYSNSVVYCCLGIVIPSHINYTILINRITDWT